MPKFSIDEALAEKVDDDATFCRSCTAPAEEGSPYCMPCGSYWEDCMNGLWDDPWPDDHPTPEDAQ